MHMCNKIARKLNFRVRFCCKWAALCDRTFEVGALEGTNVSLNGGRSPHSFSYKKVRFVKILSLCVSLSFAQFHRETTLRTPRKLPATAQTEKVLFINIPCLYTLRLTPYTLHSTP